MPTWRIITWSILKNPKIYSENGILSIKHPKAGRFFWYDVWTNPIFCHIKNQKRSGTVPEVMAECPLRGHPTHRSVLVRAILITYRSGPAGYGSLIPERRHHFGSFPESSKSFRCLTSKISQTKDCHNSLKRYQTSYIICMTHESDVIFR